MKYQLAHRAAFAGALALAGILTAPAANAQYLDLIPGAAQISLNNESLNNPSFPTGLIDTTPGATNVFIAELSSPYSRSENGQSVSGVYNSRVFRNTNGFLDFFYQINVTTATAGVTGTNVSDFAAVTTSGAYANNTDIDNGGTLFSTGGIRPARGGRSGDAAQFTFSSSPRGSNPGTGSTNDQGPGDGQIFGGQRSSIFSVRTNANTFVISNATVNGGAAANAAILAPTVVPEMGSLALLVPGMALGAVAVVKRRKK